MTGLQYGKFSISGKISYSKNIQSERGENSTSEGFVQVPQTFDSPALEFKIPSTQFYVIKGIKLKPVNGTLNN